LAWRGLRFLSKLRKAMSVSLF